MCYFVQIQSPVDKEILKCIMENLEPLESSWDTSVIDTSELLHDPLPTAMKEYYVSIKEGLFDASINANSSLKITYTPMHGVAYPYIQEAFRVAGFKVLVKLKFLYNFPHTLCICFKTIKCTSHFLGIHKL